MGWNSVCQYPSASPDHVYPPECHLYSPYIYSVSDNPEYLQAAGYYLTFQGLGVRESKTNFNRRLPDEYALKHRSENFAVNFEFFLTDPEFKCRQPTIYRFLSQRFQHDPAASLNCDNLHFVNFSALESPQPDDALISTIDINRVYEIHYLLAGKGKESMSRWGHSMIRIVYCAPETQL